MKTIITVFFIILGIVALVALVGAIGGVWFFITIIILAALVLSGWRKG